MTPTDPFQQSLFFDPTLRGITGIICGPDLTKKWHFLKISPGNSVRIVSIISSSCCSMEITSGLFAESSSVALRTFVRVVKLSSTSDSSPPDRRSFSETLLLFNQISYCRESNIFKQYSTFGISNKFVLTKATNPWLEDITQPCGRAIFVSIKHSRSSILSICFAILSELSLLHDADVLFVGRGVITVASFKNRSP